MANLRLTDIKVIDNTTVKASFTDNVITSLVVENVEINSNVNGVPDPEVLSVIVKNNILTITTRPLTPFAPYFITFKSTPGFKFTSADGQKFLFEDGKTNVELIIGAEDPEDTIRDNLIAYLKDNIYNLDSSTLIRTIINSLSKNLTKALHDIGQAKNDNYLELIVEDEKKVRGPGPYDRLNEEGTYEVMRVGKSPTNESLTTSISFSSFPFDPITLQVASISNEKLIIGSGVDVFNQFILTVKNKPVTKLTKVQFFYQNGNNILYDINKFGYQINDPRYDTDHASKLLTIDDNQIKLNESILDNGFAPLATDDYIIVSYEYKSLGRVIDQDSIIVSQVLDSIREITPPLVNQFTLKNTYIVNANDTLATSNGVQFLDPNANPPFSQAHPAFLKELAFRMDRLPMRAGEYSIDYSTGRVFCFGGQTSDGTGNFPPVATYKYRSVFSSRLDYTYDPDLIDLVASPLRDLIGLNAKITFNFEQVLIPGIDYNAQIHSEILSERIENRLKTSNSFTTQKSPITNVFRIFNETTGEIYNATRWNDNTVFFTSKHSPRVLNSLRERANFTDVLNETLIVIKELINGNNVRIFKIALQNNKIISGTEDSIGSSFNTSTLFGRTDVFQTELFFDGQLLNENTNIQRIHVGQYQIDYRNGIVYIGVTNGQNFDIGTISYKKSVIFPVYPHVISVSQIYNSISQLAGINKSINYSSFEDKAIYPMTFDVSDERFLNADTTLPYIFNNGKILVTDDIKNIRHIFDAYDLNNNVFPTDFGDGSTFNSNIITLATIGIQKNQTLVVSSGNHVVVPTISAGIEIGSVQSVLRLSDNVELFDTGGSFSANTITLSGTGSPNPGDIVQVIYSVVMNGASTPVVDYNRGDYFIDYTYIADEIIVSYEHGDNVIDFRESGSLNEGDPYFVTYKVGALRDALLKNFGSLIDISLVNNFDTTLSREHYRDILTAALQSFTKGPTIPAIKSIVSNITKIDPEIIESVFQSWSLGISHLYPSPVKTTGTFNLIPGKYDNGILIDSPDQTITFPVASNVRLEQGTLETWILPEWDGLDNDATLSFQSIKRNDQTLSPSNIYIGASSFNPIIIKDKFSINRKDSLSPIGLPSAIFTKENGLFIYYDDINKRWKLLVKDAAKADGYTYSGIIFSSGEMYDVKFIPGLGEINDTLRSFANKIEFSLNIDALDAASPDGYSDGYFGDGYVPGDGYVAGYSFDGINFLSDDKHYIFDFGKNESNNRFSLYKDGRGYLNFQVFDRGNKRGRVNVAKVSADISSWKAGEKHHIGISWIINSSDRRDKLHLFIDGLEVPNILRYGGRPIASSTDRFRTIKPEIIAGTVPLNAVAGNDLTITAGSNVVVSDTNFTSAGIVPGNTIEIFEIGFGTYTILNVLGNQLTLNVVLPTSLSSAKYSVNPYSVVVATDIDLYSNITVSVIRGAVETEIPGERAVVPGYQVSKNIFNQNILTILGDVLAGDQIAIRTLGQNHRRSRDRVFIWGNNFSVLKTRLPPPINLDQAQIFSVLLPMVSIGPGNSTFGGGVFTSSSILTSQPSNSTEGRSLQVRLTGNNVNFSTPTTVTVHGTTAAGPVFETLTFTSANTHYSTNKFKTITGVVVVAKPFDSGKNSTAIEIKERYPLTNPEGNNKFPVIRFSYKLMTGTNLSGNIGTNIVTDPNAQFLDSHIGNILVINSPGGVAGTYTITSKIDSNTVTLNSNLAANFSNGNYSLYNVTTGRSGFQNGYFYLETAGFISTPYPLPQGTYEFDYPAFLEIPFDPVTTLDAHIGSDIFGNNQAKAVIDEFRILSQMLTDTRIGESIADNEDSITTDFNSLRAFRPNKNTLMLLHFDSLPLVNSADFWISASREFRQAASSVNSNFNQSLLVTDTPLIVDNKGLLTTISEGTIEFWVSPRFDTYNDPNFRFYFDASGSAVDEVVSITNGKVKIDQGRISKVLSVRLTSDVDNTGIDYFAGGKIEADAQTVTLNRQLPYQQTPVKINYIPTGLTGDRISIYKDREGFINFTVTANNLDYQVRQPIFWQRDTWHRIKATFKFNRIDNKDEIRLFIDGEEKTTILFGSGLLFGNNIVFGQSISGPNQTLISDINFHDPINQFYIGSDYFGVNSAEARIDNLRLSNIARAPIQVSGQPKDVVYSSNIANVFPVVTDVFTTYLLNFDSLIIKTEDLALLKDKKFGLFDFSLDVIDSFDIVSSNPKIKQILEALILALKPAQSRAQISYIK